MEIYRCYLCVNVKVMLPQEGEIIMFLENTCCLVPCTDWMRGICGLLGKNLTIPVYVVVVRFSRRHFPAELVCFSFHLNQINSPLRWRQHVPLKCCNRHSTLHGVTTQNTTVSVGLLTRWVVLQDINDKQ